MRLLGISGKARHGKDFCGKLAQDIAQDEFGVVLGHWAMAHPLKANVYSDTDATLKEVTETKPPKVREALQVEGTERGRDVRGKDVWLLQAEYFLWAIDQGFSGIEGVVFTDIRFPNEVDFIRLGGRTRFQVEQELSSSIDEQTGYNDEREIALINAGEAEELADLDDAWTQTMEEAVRERMAQSSGYCLRILSDRDTLEGDFGEHRSESMLDGVNTDETFDGVIHNNRDTTIEGLKKQLRPWVRRVIES